MRTTPTAGTGVPAPSIAAIGGRRVGRRLLALAAVLSLGGALVGCGDDDGAEQTEGTTAESSGSLDTSGAWARASATMADAGAVYLTIENGTDADDALVGVSVDSTVAAAAELHETVASGEGGDDGEGGMETSTTGAMDSATTTGGMDMGGSDTSTAMGGGEGGDTMTMRPVERIEVPAGETVELAPGGLHIMLLDLADPLQPGSTFRLTLEFEQAGERPVQVEVRES